jgi:hypothetical protein
VRPRLTGLANRRLLVERLDHAEVAVAAARRICAAVERPMVLPDGYELGRYVLDQARRQVRSIRDRLDVDLRLPGRRLRAARLRAATDRPAGAPSASQRFGHVITDLLASGG